MSGSSALPELRGLLCSRALHAPASQDRPGRGKEAGRQEKSPPRHQFGAPEASQCSWLVSQMEKSKPRGGRASSGARKCRSRQTHWCTHRWEESPKLPVSLPSTPSRSHGTPIGSPSQAPIYLLQEAFFLWLLQPGREPRNSGWKRIQPSQPHGFRPPRANPPASCSYPHIGSSQPLASVVLVEIPRGCRRGTRWL